MSTVSKSAHRRQIAGTPRGALFLVRKQEWNQQLDLVDNQRGGVGGRRGCSSTDVDFHTPLSQSDSRQQQGLGWKCECDKHRHSCTHSYEHVDRVTYGYVEENPELSPDTESPESSPITHSLTSDSPTRLSSKNRSKG